QANSSDSVPAVQARWANGLSVVVDVTSAMKSAVPRSQSLLAEEVTARKSGLRESTTLSNWGMRSARVAERGGMTSNDSARRSRRRAAGRVSGAVSGADAESLGTDAVALGAVWVDDMPSC